MARGLKWLCSHCRDFAILLGDFTLVSRSPDAVPSVFYSTGGCLQCVASPNDFEMPAPLHNAVMR